MQLSPDARAAGFGLIASGAALLGLVVGLFATVSLVSAAGWLVFPLVFAVAPALAVLGLGAFAARVAPVEPHPQVAAVAAFVGGVVGIGGVFLGGLFLFLGLFLFPSMFAYAAVMLAHIFKGGVITKRGRALQLCAATALYIPPAVFALYLAVDRTLEAAGFREGAGWSENVSSAVVLLSLYALTLAAAISSHRGADQSWRSVPHP